MKFFAGLDVGSLSTDAVIVDPDGQVASYCIIETGANSSQAAAAALEQCLTEAGLAREALACLVATGYGRVSVDFADYKVTEISCHASGARALFPQVGTVIDVGGQDSKVIRVDGQGKVVDFTMNDKCAAGTGRFLEVMAAKLGLSLDQLGPLSTAAQREEKISSVCTVFAESEVVSLVAQDKDRAEIVRGLHRAIAQRVGAMASAVGVVPQVVMSGGVAKNQGVVELLSQKLAQPVLVPPEPQIVGALGAALTARQRAS